MIIMIIMIMTNIMIIQIPKLEVTVKEVTGQAASLTWCAAVTPLITITVIIMIIMIINIIMMVIISLMMILISGFNLNIVVRHAYHP